MKLRSNNKWGQGNNVHTRRKMESKLFKEHDRNLWATCGLHSDKLHDKFQVGLGVGLKAMCYHVVCFTTCHVF